MFCDLDSHDGLCRNLANLIPAVVVSVAYRLAPGTSVAGGGRRRLRRHAWAADNAVELGGDAGAHRVGGDSAGGNLAAVTALMARDRGGPALAAQLLIYPMIAAGLRHGVLPAVR